MSNQSITINNGVIYIDDTPTTDPQLIGLAMLDFAEQTIDDNYPITLKEGDVFINN